MSDDARPLIDNPYRASHTPIYVGDVNVTDLMARAWDRGFAAGDERLRSDFQSAASPDPPDLPALDEGPLAYLLEDSAASPDERLREALAFYADKGNYTAQNPVGSGAHVWRDMGQRARAALAAADREKPDADMQAAMDRADEELRAELDAPLVSDDPVPDPETNT